MKIKNELDNLDGVEKHNFPGLSQSKWECATSVQ